MSRSVPVLGRELLGRCSEWESGVCTYVGRSRENSPHGAHGKSSLNLGNFTTPAPPISPPSVPSLSISLLLNKHTSKDPPTPVESTHRRTRIARAGVQGTSTTCDPSKAAGCQTRSLASRGLGPFSLVPVRRFAAVRRTFLHADPECSVWGLGCRGFEVLPPVAADLMAGEPVGLVGRVYFTPLCDTVSQ